MKRLPTKFEIEQNTRHEQKKKDIEILGGVCLAIVIIATGLLLIG